MQRRIEEINRFTVGWVVATSGQDCGEGARCALPSLRHSVKMASMARKKTTVYLDENLLRATKIAAARSDKRDYEVVEDALRRHLGFSFLEEVWERNSGVTEEEAMRVANEEIRDFRREKRAAERGS